MELKNPGCEYMQKNKIEKHFLESSSLVKKSLSTLRTAIYKVAKLIAKTYKVNGKLIICGNGGSAAEAQHFSAELVGRYLKEKKALSAISLTTDTSTLSAIGNDYGFEEIFSRQVKAHASPKDVLLCISTSGNSMNIVNAAKEAKKMGVKVVGLSGNDGGKLKSFCDINLIIPSNHTPYIQEMHLIIIHTICDLIL